MVLYDVWPFILGATNFTLRSDYDVNGNQIYLGWAPAGSSETASVWRIIRQVFNGSNQMTQLLFPQDTSGNSSPTFNFQWSNRTSYTYS